MGIEPGPHWWQPVTLTIGLAGVSMRGTYHCHIDGAHGQRFEAEDGAVLVALSPLQHDQQFVAVLLQVVRVLTPSSDNNSLFINFLLHIKVVFQ